MFYNLRFATAIREICCWQDGALIDAALSLPISPEELADVLAKQEPSLWRNRGLSPRQAAIMTIAGALARHGEDPIIANLASFLRLALTSHSSRHPEDSRLIVSVVGLDEFDDALVKALLRDD